MADIPSREMYAQEVPVFPKLIAADWIKNNLLYRCASSPTLSSCWPRFANLLLAMLVAGCAAYGPYHANTSDEPFNSVRGPKDGRYKLAFIEFGDQGSMLDTSQLAAALQVIGKAERPLLFVYIHGWQNNAVSRDVCRFEHFIDMISRFPEMTGRKI